MRKFSAATLAVAGAAAVAANMALAAQQYLPNRPPMSVAFQGAERPVWYSATFFCDAVYEWRSDQYGAMGRVMESANVRIGTRADRRDRDIDAPLTREVFGGSPRHGARFTTPSCGGRDTAEFDVIGKLYGYALARIGPAVAVTRNAR